MKMYARIYMLANDVSDFFVELGSSFWKLVGYFSNILLLFIVC